MKQFQRWALIFLSFIIFFPSSILSQAKNTHLESYATLAARIKPAVVTIFIYDYSGRQKGIGSGFFYNDKGDIITNSHVLAKNTTAKIKTESGDIFAVESIIERDEQNDIARARTGITQKSPFLKVSPSPPAVGAKIIVAGSPKGFEQTIAEGIVSAWRKIPGKGKVLQISAPISPGSSGGPVLNMNGEVVGIVTFQFRQGQNLNFAMPSNLIFNKKKSKSTQLKFYKDKDGVIIIE